MEQQKILILLNEANDSRFVTKKWNIVNDNSKSNYDAIWDDITVVAAPAAQVAFNTCAPFTTCITKIDETIIHDAEDLDLLIPI